MEGDEKMCNISHEFYRNIEHIHRIKVGVIYYLFKNSVRNNCKRYIPIKIQWICTNRPSILKSVN